MALNILHLIAGFLITVFRLFDHVVCNCPVISGAWNLSMYWNWWGVTEYHNHGKLFLLLVLGGGSLLPPTQLCIASCVATVSWMRTAPDLASPKVCSWAPAVAISAPELVCEVGWFVHGYRYLVTTTTKESM